MDVISKRVIVAFFGIVAGIMSSVCIAAPISYKNATNPTGIPDITQGQQCQCFEAASANAMWYYDQAGGKPGLVQHTNPQAVSQNWPQDTVNLVAAINKFTSVHAGWGVHRYIYSRRPQDLTSVRRTINRGGKPEQVEYKVWGWNTTVLPAQSITSAALNAIRQTNSQFGIMGVQWHEQGKPVDQFMPILDQQGNPVRDQSGNIVPIGHELGIAGWDQADHQIVVTNGWGDHHSSNAPVSSAYYDLYNFTQVTDAANPANNRFRVTDANLIGNVAGLAGRVSDYAEALRLRILEPRTGMTIGVDRLREFFPTAAEVSDASANIYGSFELLAFNDTVIPWDELELQLPLLTPKDFSLGLVQLVIPSGWDASVWNPNVDLDLLGLASQDMLSFNGFNFRGLRFTTLGNPIAPGQGFSFVVKLSESLLTSDYLSTPLDIGVWSGDTHLESIAVVSAIPEPSTSALVLFGLTILVLLSRHTTWRSK